MYENNMKQNDVKKTIIQPQEEFLRLVLFMKDDKKILAIFPFYHNISDAEYDMLIENFFDDTDNVNMPPKNEFCLMHELEFGWGWIHNKMIYYLELAEINEYLDLKNTLITNKVIKKSFILNEE